MKQLSNITYNKTLLDCVLFFVRIFVGVAMLTHGFPKLMMLFSGKIEFMSFIGLSPKTSLVLAVLAEVLCSLFIIMGLFTRFTVLPLITTMLIAIFVMHGEDPFAKKELALLYLFHYLLILVAGPGSFSIDRMISKK